jgi:hypothetical protein
VVEAEARSLVRLVVRHPDFLAAVDDGQAGEREQQRRGDFRAGDVAAQRGERPRLIVGP